MKKSYLTLFILIGISLHSFAQTNVQVDANDVVTSNSKLVIQTSAGQSFFTGHQAGGGYAYGNGIFRAITDNPTFGNYFFDGLKWDGSSAYTTTYSVRSDGTGYFANGIGIGTSTPNTRLQVNSDNNGSGYNNWVAGNFGGTAGNRVVLGLLDGHATIGAHNNALTAWANLSLNTEGGNVGIGTTNPLSLLQVDDGCTKASIGDASGSGLNWGTSYLGFNASRSGTSWNISTDSQYNGGGVIYSNILGEIYFAPIPSTGTTDQTLSDTDIKNKITFRVSADGTTYAKKIKVELANWPDYVFKPTYSLMPLTDVKSYIDKNHHLPDMPSAEQVEKNGLDLGEMNKLLTKKVEELTLYLIEKEKDNISLQNQVNHLSEELRKELNDLKLEVKKNNAKK